MSRFVLTHDPRHLPPWLTCDVMRQSNPMIEQFIAMTHGIIEEDGFEDYLPTLLLPERKNVLVLEGVPGDEDIESAAKGWAIRSANENEDFLLAFKVDANHFKVFARMGGVSSETLCDVNVA